MEQLRPPEGAPNVVVVLLDDVGFGASSALGGPCQTPAAERLAEDGLKYNRLVRQMPRGATLGSQPHRPLRPLANRHGL